MIYLLLATLSAFVGVLLKGLLHLSIPDVIVIGMIPPLAVYKLLGNRPAFLGYASLIAMFAGGLCMLWGYTIVPILYYYKLWGWTGIWAGIFANIALPAQFFLFLIVAYLKGGAILYVCTFFSAICLGLAAFFLMQCADSEPLWTRRKKSTTSEIDLSEIGEVVEVANSK